MAGQEHREPLDPVAAGRHQCWIRARELVFRAADDGDALVAWNLADRVRHREASGFGWLGSIHDVAHRDAEMASRAW